MTSLAAPETAIADHGIIGDLQTAALVTTAHMPAALAASYLACGAAAAYTLSTPTAPSSAAE